MSSAVQSHCDRCQSPLVRNAAYCEKCGERTRRARRLTRLAVRVEVLIVIVVTLLVVGFTYVYVAQQH
jgi:predicted nucleic acid-binding Zn ribbon protein